MIARCPKFTLPPPLPPAGGTAAGVTGAACVVAGAAGCVGGGAVVGAEVAGLGFTRGGFAAGFTCFTGFKCLTVAVFTVVFGGVGGRGVVVRVVVRVGGVVARGVVVRVGVVVVRRVVVGLAFVVTGAGSGAGVGEAARAAPIPRIPPTPAVRTRLATTAMRRSGSLIQPNFPILTPTVASSPQQPPWYFAGGIRPVWRAEFSVSKGGRR